MCMLSRARRLVARLVLFIPVKFARWRDRLLVLCERMMLHRIGVCEFSMMLVVLFPRPGLLSGMRGL